jgi:hypothetical protein
MEHDHSHGKCWNVVLLVRGKSWKAEKVHFISNQKTFSMLYKYASILGQYKMVTVHYFSLNPVVAGFMLVLCENKLIYENVVEDHEKLLKTNGISCSHKRTDPVYAYTHMSVLHPFPMSE